MYGSFISAVAPRSVTPPELRVLPHRAMGVFETRVTGQGIKSHWSKYIHTVYNTPRSMVCLYCTHNDSFAKVCCMEEIWPDGRIG